VRVTTLHPSGGYLRCPGAVIVVGLALAAMALGAAIAIGAGIASAAPSQDSGNGDRSSASHPVWTPGIGTPASRQSARTADSRDLVATTAAPSAPLAVMAQSAGRHTPPGSAPPPAKPRVTQVTMTLPALTARPVNDATTATLRSAAPIKAAAPIAAPASAPRSVVDVLGTLAYDVLSAAVGLFAPAPVVPPGVPVTIGRSTLALPCGCGLPVPANWYFPDEAQPAVGLIYLQHGFFRSAANVSALATQLAARTDSIVVAPTISSNPFTSTGYWINGTPTQQAVATLFTGDRSALNASAAAAAGHPVALPTPFVLAGHSAGGNLVTGVAGYLSHTAAIADLRAVILFDPVNYDGEMQTALAALTNNVAVLTISSPPCLCNNFDSGTTALLDARPDQFVGVRLAGGTHIDSEGASTDLPAELVCGFPLPQNVAAVQTLAAGWITDALTGTRTGIYGAPGTVIDIDGARADVLG
jgi:hypothetical protein